MKSVFVVQHLHILPDGADDIKMIGIYASRNEAIAATARLALQTGFRDYPKVMDLDAGSDMQGFHIEEYEIGKDHWSEGYSTV